MSGDGDARPPAENAGEFRLHCDGASRGNPGPSSIGYVLLDPQGAEVVAKGEVLPGETTNNVAEYTALLRGVQAAMAHGVRAILVRLDSELVVRQIRGEYRVRHAGLKPLHAAVMQQIPRFERFRIEHVPREENRRADALANAALDDLVSP